MFYDLLLSNISFRIEFKLVQNTELTLATQYQLLSRPAAVKEFSTSVKTLPPDLSPPLFMT